MALYTDVSATVRTEAVILVSTIYQHKQISSANLFAFYDVMTYTVTEDPDNEVKMASLRFWGKVIDTCLVLQGTIDGQFPEVTFSKEARKIIVFNDVEIKRRLFKVLEELSENGCLAVFASALQDGPEIQNAALNVMEKFIQHLEKYKILNPSNSFNLLESNTEDSYSADMQAVYLSNQMLGRQKLSLQVFLQILNKHCLLSEPSKPISVTEQLKLFLDNLLDQS